MKRALFNIMLIAALAFSAQSCLFEQKELFDKAPSLRVNERMEQAKKTLIDSQNGWLFEMYPEGGQSYGGYAFICKFNDDQTVDVFSELAGDYSKPVSSYYKMTAEDGPCLIFDTYNELIHFLSTPSSSAYQAYQGEFEFVISDIKPDLVTVRGAKTGNTMYLRKMTEPAADYIAKLNARDSAILMSGFKGSAAGKELNAVIDIDKRQVSFTIGEDTKEVAYAVTPEGIRLYKPFEFAGGDIAALSIPDDAKTVTVTEGSIVGTVFESVFPQGYRLYDEYAGKYIFKFLNRGAEALEYEVTLEPAGDGVTYNMVGVTDYYDLKLTYSRAKGNLTLATQMIYDKNTGELLKYNGKYLGLTAVAASNAAGTSGYLTYDFSHGMMTVWNEDVEHPVYEFKNNGLYSRAINCFWLNFYTGPTQTSGSRTSGSSLPADMKPFGKDHLLTYVQSLTKVD